MNSFKAGKKLYSSTNLTFPIAKLHGFELHLERNLFGVVLSGEKKSLANKSKEKTFENNEKMRIENGEYNLNEEELADLAKVTNIRFVEVYFLIQCGFKGFTYDKCFKAVMMTFRGDFSHFDDERKMSEWEMNVYKYSKDIFNSSILEVLVIGNEIVDFEMNRDAQRTAPYFALGILLEFSVSIFKTHIYTLIFYILAL